MSIDTTSGGIGWAWLAHPVLYIINTSGIGAKPSRVADINLAYQK
jgi:hypothetical protein